MKNNKNKLLIELKDLRALSKKDNVNYSCEHIVSRINLKNGLNILSSINPYNKDLIKQQLLLFKRFNKEENKNKFISMVKCVVTGYYLDLN